MSKKRLMGMAVAQLGPVQINDSKKSVVARLISMLEESASRGAELVVFPELALTTFFPRYWMSEAEAVETYFEHSMPGPETLPIFDRAEKLGVGFYLGYAELTPDGHRYNTAVLVDKTGKIIGKYRKTHLPGHSELKPSAPFQHLEKKYFEVGNTGFKVWQMQGMNIGMCICNDRRWPETWRVLSLQSAEVGVVGYNTPDSNIHWNEPAYTRMTHHELCLRAASYQNALWIGAAAKAGSEDGHMLIGGSMIVAPNGEIVSRSQSVEDEVIFYNCDLSMAESYKKYVFNFAEHRRPEHYHMIVDRAGAQAPAKVDPMTTNN